METSQAANEATKTLKSLFSNPSELLEIFNDPGKNGLAFYKALSNKDKQYLAFAAGAGLIIYGLVLRRQSR